MSKRRRLKEWGKTLLIVLLSCSALYLASLTLLPGGAGFWSRFSAPEALGGDETQLAFSEDTLYPAALAVTWSEGRWGCRYDPDGIPDYPQLSTLLSEALTTAGVPQSISQSDWLEALEAPGIYWEYLGDIPLEHLTRWLSDRNNAALAGFQARRLVVSGRALYFRAGNAAYSAPLSSDLAGDLRRVSENFTANGATFAFQDEAFPLLRADTLFLSATPSMPTLLVEAPLAVNGSAPNDALTRLLTTLSFHPQTNPLYGITGGWAVTDSGETLRLTGGVVSYRQNNGDAPRYPTGDAPLDVTRSMAEQTVGALGGEATLYLRSCEEVDGVLTVTYGYAYRGAPVQLGSDGYCAQFVVEHGAVTAFTLRPRHYTASSSAPLLLPQEQAAAAHTGSRRWSMGILYEDRLDASPLAPFWAYVPE